MSVARPRGVLKGLVPRKIRRYYNFFQHFAVKHTEYNIDDHQPLSISSSAVKASRKFSRATQAHDVDASSQVYYDAYEELIPVRVPDRIALPLSSTPSLSLLSSRPNRRCRTHPRHNPFPVVHAPFRVCVRDLIKDSWDCSEMDSDGDSALVVFPGRGNATPSTMTIVRINANSVPAGRSCVKTPVSSSQGKSLHVLVNQHLPFFTTPLPSSA
ncbi:hypothetical protein OG21DRAFT_1488598 [Imleria badia]|nr:hypothetical protein OG21DRAFT_1488598 [Imleria badia]